jgi:zinc transporter
VSEIGQALEATEGITWLHFNLANARAATFLTESAHLPRGLRERIARRDGRSLVEVEADGLSVVVNDVAFDSSSDAGEAAALWAYATPRRVISARSHPLKSVDLLRQAMREGIRFDSGIELVAHLFALRTDALREETAEMGAEADAVEDEILRGDIPEQRERLGRVRRRCAHIRRHFLSDRTALQKVVSRRPDWMSAADAGLLHEVADELGYLREEVSGLYERAKLLQEELASRVAEQTGRQLYVLSILSAVLLPMTLITGVFGMNVAGLPGLEGETSFWWTMLLIVAAGAFTLLLLKWKRLL